MLVKRMHDWIVLLYGGIYRENQIVLKLRSLDLTVYSQIKVVLPIKSKSWFMMPFQAWWCCFWNANTLLKQVVLHGQWNTKIIISFIFCPKVICGLKEVWVLCRGAASKWTVSKIQLKLNKLSPDTGDPNEKPLVWKSGFGIKPSTQQKVL